MTFTSFSERRKRSVTNSNVSRTQVNLMKEAGMKWKPHQTLKKNQRSQFWDYMGEIHREFDGASGSTRYDNQLYCKLCFQAEMNKENGLLSKVYSLGENTATGNFFNHAAVAHPKEFSKGQSNKLTGWLAKASKGQEATSQFDLNRDIVLWLCQDLEPFEIVEKRGFQSFNDKNLHLKLPSSRTLATTALVDVFFCLNGRVKELLSNSVSANVMMDGWTDQHNRRPYFGVRLSTIMNSWDFQVVTLAVKPVESHTSENLCLFIKQLLDEFLPDKKMLLFDTTDGAANMVKLSRLLGHERQTCIAHSLHNLLVTDAISKVSELDGLLAQCKQAVQTLHFKTYMLQEESLRKQEVEMFDSIADVQLELNADENSPVAEGLTHEHQTLKHSVPTRWNSIYTMVSSILDLHEQVNEVLKRIGKATLCFMNDDIELLQNLKIFLEPFLKFTLIVSEVSPNLSAIPLIRGRIKKMCVIETDDHPIMKRLKKLINENLDRRIPNSDLVKLSCVFDPAVRDMLFSNEECKELIKETYEKLKSSRYISC